MYVARDLRESRPEEYILIQVNGFYQFGMYAAAVGKDSHLLSLHDIDLRNRGTLPRGYCTQLVYVFRDGTTLELFVTVAGHRSQKSNSADLTETDEEFFQLAVGHGGVPFPYGTPTLFLHEEKLLEEVHLNIDECEKDHVMRGL